MARYVHELEDIVKDGGAPTEPRDLFRFVSTQARALRQRVDEFVDEYGKILGTAVTGTERAIEIPLSRVQAMIAEAAGPTGLDRIRADLIGATYRPIGEYFQPYAAMLRDVAERLGKVVEPLLILNHDIAIYPERFHHLVNTFVHVFRNAVDHGLESPEERVLSGKSEAGRVSVRFERIDRDGRDEVSIVVEDDGRGIDPARLREVLAEKGMAERYVGASDEQILMALCEPGFSTRRSATDLSGRGVGLDALKTAAEALDGSLRLTSVLGRGTCIEVTVPFDSPDRLKLHPAS